MRAISCIVLAAMVTIIAGASLDQLHFDLKDAPELFEQFVKEYNRSYKDEADRKVHYEAFVNTLKIINASNSPNSTAVYGINKFADYTLEEMKGLMGVVSKFYVS